MDALTTAEVGLGSAALATALIAWFKNLGIAPSQKVILIWAMLIPIGIQVLMILAQDGAVTMQNIAAAILAGITSGLAAGGIHDHSKAAAESVVAARAAVKAANAMPAQSPEQQWETALARLRAAVAATTLTREQAQEQANGVLASLHATYPYTTVPKVGEFVF